MKKYFFILLFQVSLTFIAYAQWNGTNPIYTNSNVGIGKTDPDGQLDIRNSAGDGYVFDNGYGTDQTKLILKENNTNIFSVFYDGSGTAPNNKLFIKDESYDLNIMTFVQQNGYVGIGKDSPEHILHVRASSPTLRLECETNNASGSLIRFTENLLQGAFLQYNGDANRFDIGMHNAQSSLESDDTPAISVLRSNNYVGIGTTDPKAKLSVNGTIISSEIKVLADISQYPDFVFSNEYKLRKLEEVEMYINENKHLPEIPNANEVKEGIALGEMNNKLLQKIEELTLYMIEMNNRVNSLETENFELKVKIEVLEAKE